MFGALRRRLLRMEVYGRDGEEVEGRPYRTAEHEYDVQLDTTAGGAEIAVPRLRRSLEQQWERAAEPFAFREIQYLAYDGHGNLERQRTRAWRASRWHPTRTC